MTPSPHRHVDRYVTGDKDRTDRAAYRLIDQSLP